jgi:glucose-1-phosphate thymidylyltransferase
MVQIDAGAVIENSIVRGPAIIGSNAVIQNAYIGPFTSIGSGAQIRNSQIENSIVCDEAIIQNVDGRLDSCLLGKGVRIESVHRKPTSTSFVLGDNSSILLPKS